MPEEVNIYITNTHILLANTPPNEDHALIGPYDKTTLSDTIASFPDLRPPIETIRFYHPEHGLVGTYDLRQFAELNKLDYNRLKAIIQSPGKTTKGWMFIPKGEPEAIRFYNFKLNARKWSKSKYSSSLSLKKT